jgi:hypothetical protein
MIAWKKSWKIIRWNDLMQKGWHGKTDMIKVIVWLKNNKKYDTKTSTKTIVKLRISKNDNMKNNGDLVTVKREMLKKLKEPKINS